MSFIAFLLSQTNILSASNEKCKIKLNMNILTFELMYEKSQINITNVEG